MYAFKLLKLIWVASFFKIFIKLYFIPTQIVKSLREMEKLDLPQGWM